MSSMVTVSRLLCETRVSKPLSPTFPTSLRKSRDVSPIRQALHFMDVCRSSGSKLKLGARHFRNTDSSGGRSRRSLPCSPCTSEGFTVVDLQANITTCRNVSPNKTGLLKSRSLLEVASQFTSERLLSFSARGQR